jgi:hypothetical protein
MTGRLDIEAVDLLLPAQDTETRIVGIGHAGIRAKRENRRDLYTRDGV